MAIAGVLVAAGRAVVQAPAVTLIDKVIGVTERDIVVAATVLADVCKRETSVNNIAIARRELDRRRTADVVTRARVWVAVGRAKVELPPVTLVGDEVWVTVRRLALDHWLRGVDGAGDHDGAERSNRDERRGGEVHCETIRSRD